MVTLLKVILFLLAVGLAIVIGRWIVNALPQGTREQLAKLARELRVLTGRYTVRDLVQSMIAQLYASAVPSLKRSYLPNHVTFGIHPQDAQRWGGFFPDLEREVTLILESRVRNSKRLVLSGPLRIKLQIDQSARPGRPTFVAGTRAGTAAPVGGDGAFATATALTDTALADTTLFGGETQDENSFRAARWQLVVDDEKSLRRKVPLFDGATIGRAETAGVRIHGRGVSREHAQIRVDPTGSLEIVDLRSVNGTFVDGQKVATAPLTDGQTIRFGQTITAQVSRVD